MKNRLAILSSVLLLVFFSCKKEISKVIYKGGTAPTLTASQSGTIPLSFVNKDKEAVKLSWTNPDYQFNTGVSSQNVTYKVEIDTTGSNFTNPNRKIISVSNDLALSISQNDFNDYLLNQLNLKPGMSHNIEVRVTSYLANSTVPLSSNVLKFTATPYSIPPKITPPASGTLYIVGSAVAGGWDNPIASQHVTAQQFTQVSPTFYTITLPLIGGGEYKLIAVNGSWNDQWSTATADDPNEIYGGDFVFNGQNVLAPPTSGTYRIDVDFQRGKFTVTKL